MVKNSVSCAEGRLYLGETAILERAGVGPERSAAEDLLLAELTSARDAQVAGREVMLTYLPTVPDLYAPLIDHARVSRVVVLSSGFTRNEACDELKKDLGMSASFSRALLSDLRVDMSDDDFDTSLGAAIKQICAASAS